MISTAQLDAPSSRAPRKRPPAKRWAPRMWLGCNFPGWLRLLARNRFAVEPRCLYLYIASVDTVVSLGNSALGWAQKARFGRRVSRTQIEEAPIFILGHWRTGTTLLHELLARDPRFTAPTMYQCFAPNHFLLTEKLFPRVFGFLMPERRPMDDMPTGWSRPQEDEFALCNLGLPSPYLRIAFPNRPAVHTAYSDLEQLDPRARRRWIDTWVNFLKQVTMRNPKRLVLKTPLHTLRIKTILEVFPEARFVNLVRNPYDVFASTMKLWKALYQGHGLQRPSFLDLEEHVLETFARMHAKLEEGRLLVDPSRLYDLRYEDLVRDPLGQLQALYGRLKLGGFREARPGMQAYLAETADYRANHYQLSDHQRAAAARRWEPYFARYGYPIRQESPRNRECLTAVRPGRSSSC